MATVDQVQLTKEASKFWNALPAHARSEILRNVYCVHCGPGVSIVSPTGMIERGDLVLEGKCSKCGGEVARLVEGPDA